MKESAQIGFHYIRSQSQKFGIAPEFYKENDLHVHIPEGAVPKDGPSAGITMATAMLSAITGEKVRGDVAMTGEITLRGRVLPVGGLKEKLLAAKVSGIKTVLLSAENERNIAELDAEVIEELELIYAETMEEVIKNAFLSQIMKGK